ncbi:hypothetical protein ACFP1Z_18030 [Streptomyces gamaensis]|uniref:Uncharacterized protein n=1 Tax=Streptomyces gamaensis TaxID=1763542 RepID=A0ABW0Z0V7_9ACTN
MANHVQGTGHTEFQRNMGDTCTAIPPEGAVIAGEVVKALPADEHARTHP